MQARYRENGMKGMSTVAVATGLSHHCLMAALGVERSGLQVTERDAGTGTASGVSPVEDPSSGVRDGRPGLLRLK